MPDDVDDLILKMQHLEAAAKAERAAHAREGWASGLKSRAQHMAAEAQTEVSSAEHDEAEGQSRMERARTPGLPPLEAADLLLSGRQLAAEAKTRLGEARARLNFARDQMDEAERAEYDALRASAMAQAHTELADSGADSSKAPDLSVAPSDPASDGST